MDLNKIKSQRRNPDFVTPRPGTEGRESEVVELRSCEVAE